jgi:predicted cupin superfamily sugar epimerase
LCWNEKMNAAARRIITRLGLQPLPVEGGFFAQTYVSAQHDTGGRPVGSAIYYLLERGSFSAIHRLRTDELWHFYAGDAVELLQLHPDGHGEQSVLGTDLSAVQRPQVTVRAGVWQGARLAPARGAGSGYALLGCTLAPAWAEREFEPGDRLVLTAGYPEWSDMICALTRNGFARRHPPHVSRRP